MNSMGGADVSTGLLPGWFKSFVNVLCCDDLPRLLLRVRGLCDCLEVEGLVLCFWALVVSNLA